MRLRRRVSTLRLHNAHSDDVDVSADASAEESAASNDRDGFAGSAWKALRSVDDGDDGYARVRLLALTASQKVYEAMRDGERLALKEVDLKALIFQDEILQSLKDIDEEVHALRELQWASPAIVALRDCWMLNDFSKAFVVLDWAPKSLRRLLSEQRTSRATLLEKAEQWLAQISAGTAAMHTAGYAHGSICAASVRIAENLSCAQLSDVFLQHPLAREQTWDVMSSFTSSSKASSLISSALGLSRNDIANDSAQGRVYQSPELLEGSPPSVSSDVFALGVVAVEMVTGRLVGADPEETVQAQHSRVRTLLAPMVGSAENWGSAADTVALVPTMLDLQQNLRPSARHLASSPPLRKHVVALTCADELQKRILQ